MVPLMDNESVDNGECEREGVGGLSFDEPGVATPGDLQERDSYGTSGMTGAGISKF